MAAFAFKTIGLERIIVDTQKAGDQVVQAGAQELRAQVRALFDRTRAGLSGGVLRTRSGKLLRSLQEWWKVDEERGTIRGGVAVANDDAFYGRFWDLGFGGETVNVRPRRKRALLLRKRASKHIRFVPKQQRSFLYEPFKSTRTAASTAIRDAMAQAANRSI